jgi:hypothetical protein
MPPMPVVNTEPYGSVLAWIERHRQLWNARFDELDNIVEELKQKEKIGGRKNKE